MLNVRFQGTVFPDRVDDLKRTLTNLFANVPFGEEFISAKAFQDPKDETEFLVHEKWDADEEWARRHLEEPVLQAFFAEIEPMFKRKTFCHPVTVVELGKPAAEAAGGPKSLWVSLEDTIVVEKATEFEAAAKKMVEKLAGLKECNYVLLTRDVHEPSKYYYLEQYSADPEWYAENVLGGPFLTEYLDVVQKVMVHEPTFTVGWDVVLSGDSEKTAGEPSILVKD